tara:strand:+ start:755 stop:1006 length:252 start_codon:yes stop_codon:yes gene_type:complete
MSYDKIKIDQNIPLPPRNTGKKLNQELLDIVSKIPIHGSIAFDDMKEMERFRNYICKVFGKGSATARTVPHNGKVQYRLWRMR